MQCTANDMLTLVMDPERYRAVDRKIGAISWVRCSEDLQETLFRFRPKLWLLPSLVRSTQRVVRHEDQSISIRALPSWSDRLAYFEASVVCSPAGSGVLVQRQLQFWLSPPLRWTITAPLRRWLATDVQHELASARDLLERNGATTSDRTKR